MDLDSIYNQDCTKCGLSVSRTQIVWGRGFPGSDLMIVGEGPGRNEDREGSPFVGRSGALLDEALVASFGPEFSKWAYITNMVKCRPPENRNPTDKEVAACAPYLQEEINLVEPKLIVTLGKVAAEGLLQHPVKITKQHGHLDFMDDGQAVLICYHPAYILRNQKPEIRQVFFQAFTDARRIAYGPDANFNLPTGSVGRTHSSSGKF